MNQELHLPKGFKYTGIHAGLKGTANLDLALIYSDVPCEATGVFTQNHFPGEPVKLAKEILKEGRLQAIIANSKISNVATGEAGQKVAQHICSSLAQELSLEEKLCVISSTGIIGRLYPEGVIEKALPKLCQSLKADSDSFMNAAKAIMTTDTKAKAFSAKVGSATINIMAKGAGMIDPNMATMLAFITTDAKIPHLILGDILKRVVNQSFNNLSIDFDTSTSDSCFLMANGLAGEVDLEAFEKALKDLCWQCSEALVMDGEGVDTLIDCQVGGSTDHSMARAVASSIVNSPLVKTMITGADPNWGRLIMAIGKVDDTRLCGVAPTIHINGICVFKEGAPHEHDLTAISNSMKTQDRVLLEVDLRRGNESIRYLGGNLTKEYVSINADYTT
ncbi:MAG: bifunctional glutamate N-acetyltransferase/amino-acid acetyltransferase ArgJ [Planctomycetes bacterium]|nr:bifunctional glutamate N-acetyltransferase/amino-acid acetyltransferase ArgJ [Planctomycetota bacterium]